MLPEEFLAANRIRFSGETFVLGSRRFVRAGDVSGAEASVDLKAAQLIIDCSAVCYGEEILSAGASRYGEMSPVAVGGYANYELFAQQGDLGDTGGALVSQPHGRGTTEQLSVIEGALTVRAGEADRHLSLGDTARYPADVTHAIRATDGPARAFLIVKSG